MELHTLQAPTLNLIPMEAGLLHTDRLTSSSPNSSMLGLLATVVHSLQTSEIFSAFTSVMDHCQGVWSQTWTKGLTVECAASTTITEKTKRKVLVLDMDETLIHSKLTLDEGSPNAPFQINIPYGEKDCIYYVYDRPFVFEFLATMAKWYDLVIFTASISEYADPIIDWLEDEVKKRHATTEPTFKGRYYRQHCTYYDGIFTKDLSQINSDLREIALVDNSEFSFLVNPENAIPIRTWTHDDPSDPALMDLIGFLLALNYVNDVRSILGLRLGLENPSLQN
ncbi:Nuclear envelope morphology protein 1 [Basidiobolus ranarum]|uniref:Nuclear envelope morphology protein 1 n=1 Tax=Basidiobolus ranarum TaxID=34480 RepID=A0ABR2WRE9_9FUNG